VKRAILILAAVLVACGKKHPSSPLDGGSDGGPPSDGGTVTGDGGIPIPPVKIKALLPSLGPTDGGGTVLITGSGFVQGFALHGGADVSKETSVDFAGSAATNLDVIDDNRIEVTVPAGAAGPADVQVVNPNGSGTCAGCYRYITPVKVLSIDPPSGASGGGTPVTIHGQGFGSDVLLTIGGRELISAVLTDAQTATGFTPPGTAGPADVLAIAPNGSGSLRSGFVYQDALRVDSVSPPVVPTAGGPVLTIEGAGFSAAAQVQIDGAAAPSAWVDSGHLQLFAPAHAAGAVDVAVDGATLPHGLAYADPGGAQAAYAVQPARGPSAGGITVHVLGTGLTGATVSFGGAAATVTPVSDVQLDAELPPGTPGSVDVHVGAQTLAAAFQYDAPFAVTGVAPASAPASGTPAVQVSLQGIGFDQTPLHVFVGALEATVVTATATAISATAPAGAPGPADVIVNAGNRTARLSGAFAFTAPLSLKQVSPALGAQAGGTRVSLFGSGLTPDLTASIGGAAVASLQLLSPTQATALTPPGTPGARDVAATAGTSSSTLTQAFTYFDPTSDLGGATGGPLLGVLNVTVLDFSAYKSGGVVGATVQVVLHDGTLLAGLTDKNGQVTFSDDRLVLPAQVTAIKDQYDSVTIAEVATANLTLEIQGAPGTPPPPPPNPNPTPPSPPQTASIAGNVYGFKLAPGTVLTANQRAAARVSIAREGIYGLPPFAGAVSFSTVTADGGQYNFDKLYSFNPTTLYAVFGIEDTAASSFTPLLLGVVRGVRPDPNNPVTNADIILDTHLDQEVLVTVLNPPAVSGGHDAFVDLDLGSSGAIPLDRVTENDDAFHFRFHHLPLASGQGLVFVDQYGAWQSGAVVTPVSVYLRRVFDDISAGVTLGPLLPFPVLAQSGPDVISWTLGDSPLQPNLMQLRVADGTATQDTSWSVLLPGTSRQISMPAPVRARLQSGTHQISITSSVAPGFDFTHWNDEDLSSGSWTAYAYANGSFKLP